MLLQQIILNLEDQQQPNQLKVIKLLVKIKINQRERLEKPKVGQKAVKVAIKEKPKLLKRRKRMPLVKKS